MEGNGISIFFGFSSHVADYQVGVAIAWAKIIKWDK